MAHFPGASEATRIAKIRNNLANDSPPPVPLTLEGIADFLQSERCQSVILLTGAGMSSGAGIPDFRSPGGMYDTLKPELLTATEQQRQLMAIDPTYVVERQMFRQNPFPFLEVRRPFILGTHEAKWKATIAHRFVELLAKHGKLTRLYTQNIDGLDFQCEGIPPNKIVPVHGSIGRVACEACGAECDREAFVEKVRRQIKNIYGPSEDAGPAKSTPILCGHCGEPAVKPTTVLFGGSLPEIFFQRREEDLPRADLLIIAGTSLLVSPANKVAYEVPDHTLRLIVNREPVGEELGIRYVQSKRDVFAQGDCDDVFLRLICLLNWQDELVEVANAMPEASQARLRDLKRRNNGTNNSDGQTRTKHPK